MIRDLENPSPIIETKYVWYKGMFKITILFI